MLLRIGSKGEQVRKLQIALKNLGYFITVDGDYGVGTAEFVKRFQKEKGLKVDGIVGSETWECLFSEEKTKEKKLYIDVALEYQGVPYKSGGMDKSGIDCSGLVNVATGQKKRVWCTSFQANPPGLWQKLDIKANTIDNFISQLKRGDLLLWKGHVAFYHSGEQIFHAQKAGTRCGFTKDLKLYWLKSQGFPTVFRQLLT